MADISIDALLNMMREHLSKPIEERTEWFNVSLESMMTTYKNLTEGAQLPEDIISALIFQFHDENNYNGTVIELEKQENLYENNSYGFPEIRENLDENNLYDFIPEMREENLVEDNQYYFIPELGDNLGEDNFDGFIQDLEDNFDENNPYSFIPELEDNFDENNPYSFIPELEDNMDEDSSQNSNLNDYDLDAYIYWPYGWV